MYWENKTLWEKLIGGAEILCVFGGQIGKVKGEGVKSGYRFKGLITWAGLARFAKISAP